MLENLLENARQKISAGDASEIVVALNSDKATVRCFVHDDGRPMPDAVAADLFRGPVPSRNGLGVGLYQSAKLAEESGGALTLNDNTDGHVCFEFSFSCD